MRDCSDLPTREKSAERQLPFVPSLNFTLLVCSRALDLASIATDSTPRIERICCLIPPDSVNPLPPPNLNRFSTISSRIFLLLLRSIVRRFSLLNSFSLRCSLSLSLVCQSLVSLDPALTSLVAYAQSEATSIILADAIATDADCVLGTLTSLCPLESVVY